MIIESQRYETQECKFQLRLMSEFHWKHHFTKEMLKKITRAVIEFHLEIANFDRDT